MKVHQLRESLLKFNQDREISIETEDGSRFDKLTVRSGIFSPEIYAEKSDDQRDQDRWDDSRNE